MKHRLKFACLALVAAGASWFAPAVKADEWDKKTVLTFNEPVEVPGKVLAAGTYVFKLLDSESDRNIVEIYTADEKHLVTTLMAIPDYREEPAGKTIVTFEERPSGSPEALHAWFYPGDNYGVQFVYRKSDRQYSARSEQPVIPAATSAPPVEQNDSDRSVPIVTEEKQEVIMAQATPPAPPENTAPDAVDTAPATLPDTLPQTSGNFGSILLFGIVLLSGGFTAIRFATRQS